jgi:DNA-binding GntR family transcriptional regulator
MAKEASLTGMAYRAIREEMLTCRLSPGSNLNVKKLSERYQVSLGAIREALSRLISEGFVLADGRGFRAAPISVDELHDLTRTRVEIEGRCLSNSMTNGGLEWESRIVAALHCLSKTPMRDMTDASRLNESYASAHATLHAALVSACDSPWLLRLRDLLYAQSERYRYLAVPLAPEDRNVVEEHTDLANAVLARDHGRALELLGEHLSRTANALLVKPRAGALVGEGAGTQVTRPLRVSRVPRRPGHKVRPSARTPTTRSRKAVS